MKALLIGRNEPEEILLSQVLVDGLCRRGYEVEHLLPSPQPETPRILRNIAAEHLLHDPDGVNGMRPKYALVINLNPNPVLAKMAARMAQIKGYGFMYEPSSSRVLVTGKALRYLELQRTSEKYPAFHRVDIYESLLNEIEIQEEGHQPKKKLKPQASSHIAVALTSEPEWQGLQRELEAASTLQLKFVPVPLDGLEAGPLQALREYDFLVTDSKELALKASSLSIPVALVTSDESEMAEVGPYSEGSFCASPLQVHSSQDLSSHITEQIQRAVRGEVGPSGQPRMPWVKPIPHGPRVLWPDMDNLTESQLWDLLLKFSTWVLHFRKPQESLASISSNFSVGLLGERIHVHNRFLFHSQLQNIAIIQQTLEELLQQSGGSLKETTLSAVLSGTPLPRAYAIGWLGLRDDERSQRPSVGLIYQVRLFLTHLKLQRQLLAHCLGIFEGDSEQVYSD